MKLKQFFFILHVIALLFNQYSQSKNIALCVVATGKYSQFIKPLVKSANNNFLPNHNVSYFIFTDQKINIDQPNVNIIPWPHKKWPFSTLMRFEAYSKATESLNKMDYIYACNSNMLFTDQVNDEILGDLVGTIHPAYYKKNFPIDTIEINPKSSATFNPKKNTYFFSHAFFGGKSANFLNLTNWCRSNISQDLKNNIVCKKHDEMHLNKYFFLHPPSVTLSPKYCFPETQPSKSTPIKPALVNLKVDTKELHKFNPVHQRDHNFVILIPSYNNIEYYKKNVDSALNQNYQNYRIVYIDDCSTDGTGKAVEEYINSNNKKHIITIVHNPKRMLALENIYNSIHNLCKDHEIIVMLDGDDQLAHPNVLNFLNNAYKENDVWLTHGSLFFINKKVKSRFAVPIKDTEIALNNFREWDSPSSHLRTFYAWLFKLIKKDDLLINGEFLTMTSDTAIYMPMMEMAGFHHIFIDEILYLYNDKNPISDMYVNPELQGQLNTYIKKKKSKYQPLSISITEY